ncbi:MAG: c-type cytochrome [Anaerolineales bacterium]|nr:c-type cytochrome [Anaerolineales bacterium]
MRVTLWWTALLVGLAALALIIGGADLAQAQTEPPPPDMPPLPRRLDPPPTVYPPTQVSQGSGVYYLVCMACHGDQGQGLTDEWRGALDLPDQNCWQSKCHAANHPPGGFVFPKIVPALASPGMLARFDTALDLYLYIKNQMPFQAPGSLSDEEYWQLTAFLLALNRVEPGQPELDAENAAGIELRQLAVGGAPAQDNRPPDWLPAWLPALILPALLALGLILWLVLRHGAKGKKIG